MRLWGNSSIKEKNKGFNAEDKEAQRAAEKYRETEKTNALGF